MARRKRPGRIPHKSHVNFKEGQTNLVDVLTRLSNKVETKEELADVTTTVETNIQTFDTVQQEQAKVDETQYLQDFLDGLYN
jgi:hypothetical protein